MDVVCQILAAQHIPAYRQLRLESLRMNPECFGASYDAEKEKPVLFFEEQIRSQTETVMIGAFDNQQLIGICGLIAMDDEKYLLVGLYVTAEYRGLGISMQLVQHAQAILAQSMRTAMVLTVYESNQAAFALYKKAGFVYQSTLGEEIVMQWNDDDYLNG